MVDDKERENNLLFLKAFRELARSAPHNWQTILAKKIGVKPEHIKNVLLGHEPLLELMKKFIARYFNLSIGEMLEFGKKLTKKKTQQEE